jgi:hypothetical protein
VDNAESGVVRADIGALIRRIVLFDHFILDSIRLREFPALVETFGAKGVVRLLDSGVMTVRQEPITFAQTGQAAALGVRNGGNLPLGSYSFGVVQVDQSEDLKQCLGELTRTLGRSKKTEKLKTAIVDHLLARPASLAERAQEQLDLELRLNAPELAQSVAMAASQELGSLVPPDAFAFSVRQLGGGDFRTETDMQARLGVTEEFQHGVVEAGLLGVAGLNLRLAEMEAFNAVTGFRPNEISLLEGKLSFLLHQLDPNAREESFQRVIELRGLPDVVGTLKERVDVGALLALREDDEWQAFRAWLRGADSLPDDEIADQLRSASAKTAAIVHGTPGRIVRFALVTAAGFLGIGRPAEITLGGIDEFLIDRVVPRPGPISFVSRFSKSVFNG